MQRFLNITFVMAMTALLLAASLALIAATWLMGQHLLMPGIFHFFIGFIDLYQYAASVLALINQIPLL